MNKIVLKRIIAFLCIGLNLLFYVYDAEGVTWPIPDSPITSAFGPRNVSAGPFHFGIDIRAKTPTPVRSAIGGNQIKISGGEYGVIQVGLRYLHLTIGGTREVPINLPSTLTLEDERSFNQYYVDVARGEIGFKMNNEIIRTINNNTIIPERQVFALSGDTGTEGRPHLRACPVDS